MLVHIDYSLHGPKYKPARKFRLCLSACVVPWQTSPRSLYSFPGGLDAAVQQDPEVIYVIRRVDLDRRIDTL
jgi:hypothetical protein